MDCFCLWITILYQQSVDRIIEKHIKNIHKKGGMLFTEHPPFWSVEPTGHIDYFNSISLFNKASLLAISQAVWNTNWARLANNG